MIITIHLMMQEKLILLIFVHKINKAKKSSVPGQVGLVTRAMHLIGAGSQTYMKFDCLLALLLDLLQHLRPAETHTKLM